MDRPRTNIERLKHEGYAIQGEEMPREYVEVIENLRPHEIELIVDVRRFPGSRRLPQFSGVALQKDLARAGIQYRWIQELGGRRRSSAGTSSAWRNASFHAYAEHITTEEFAGGLEELLMLGPGLRTAVMCAEALWWRCHRRIIADVLTTLGVQVLHIMANDTTALHQITAPARVVRGQLSYSPRSRG
jgi:uncharacterized protein (DUF488 family)